MSNHVSCHLNLAVQMWPQSKVSASNLVNTHNGTITERNDSQSHNNKTQLVINEVGSFMAHADNINLTIISSSSKMSGSFFYRDNKSEL